MTVIQEGEKAQLAQRLSRKLGRAVLGREEVGQRLVEFISAVRGSEKLNPKFPYIGVILEIQPTRGSLPFLYVDVSTTDLVDREGTHLNKIGELSDDFALAVRSSVHTVFEFSNAGAFPDRKAFGQALKDRVALRNPGFSRLIYCS